MSENTKYNTKKVNAISKSSGNNNTPPKGGIIVSSKVSFAATTSIGLPISTWGGYSKKGVRYIPYSNDGQRSPQNNIYPQQVARLVYDSPTNGAAIDRKSFMIKGQGFDYEKILDKKAISFLENINKYAETSNDILEKIAWDYATFSGFAIKVGWNSAGKIGEVYHIPFSWVRVGECDEQGYAGYYVLSNNWDLSLTATKEYNEVIPAFNPKVFESGIPVDKEFGIPLPNENQIENAYQLIYYWNYKPIASNGQLYYPIPDYAGAMDSIETEALICVSNNSKISNGFGGKTIVNFPSLPTSDEERLENDTNLKDSFAGAHNDGAIITTYSPSKDEAPIFTQIQPLDAETYINVDKVTKQSIISGHQIPAILLEYNYGGGFNNRAEEMRVAFDQYQATKILSYQQNIVRVFKKIMMYAGFDNIDIQIMPFVLPKEEDTPTNAKTQGTTSIA